MTHAGSRASERRGGGRIRFLLPGVVVAAGLLGGPLQRQEACASNGALAVSTSPQAAGRGGTDLAVGQDGYSLISNPAALSNLEGSRLDLGLNVRFSAISYTNEMNRDLTDKELPGLIPSFALVVGIGGRRSDPVEEDGWGPGPVAPFESDPLVLQEGRWDVWQGSQRPGPRRPIRLEPGRKARPRPARRAARVEAPKGPPLLLGLALHGVTGNSAKATFRTPVFTEGESERSDFKVVGLSVGASWRCGPRYAFGVTLTGLRASLDQSGITGGSTGTTDGYVRNFTGNQVNPTDEFFMINGDRVTWNDVFGLSGAPSTFAESRVDIDDAQGYGFSATFGFMGRLADWLTLGIAYRTPGYLSPLKGKAHLDASRAVETGGGALDQIQSDFLGQHLPHGGVGLGGTYDFSLEGMRIPQSLGIGVGLRSHPRLWHAIDLKWVDWSDAFGVFDVKLTNGNGADMNEIASNQQRASIDTATVYDWQDQFVVAMGSTWAATDRLHLRLGYNWGRSPTDSRTTGPFLASTTEHHATAGVGLQLERTKLEVAYVHGFRNVTSIKGRGYKADYNGVRHSAEQDSLWFGLSYDY